MKLGGLNHVAVVVRDLEAAIGHWERLGARLIERSHLAETQTDAAVVELGGKHFELLSSRAADSRVGRILRERGEGIHHLSFEVEHIEERLAEARAEGLRVLDATPRSGLHGRKIAFLDPRDTSGTLIELVEEVPQPESSQR
jgi:methylmalonyl-CoA/ethylmalonyl-CoA epimerase